MTQEQPLSPEGEMKLSELAVDMDVVCCGAEEIANLLRPLFLKIEAAERERDEAVEKEQARWQKAIDAVVYRYDNNRDGSGCDSGDPLDLTLTELNMAFDKLRANRDRLAVSR